MKSRTRIIALIVAGVMVLSLIGSALISLLSH